MFNNIYFAEKKMRLIFALSINNKTITQCKK